MDFIQVIKGEKIVYHYTFYDIMSYTIDEICVAICEFDDIFEEDGQNSCYFLTNKDYIKKIVERFFNNNIGDHWYKCITIIMTPAPIFPQLILNSSKLTYPISEYGSLNDFLYQKPTPSSAN
jgi:hypothetical protein